MESFNRLPLGQVRFLLKLVDDPDSVATADGKVEGGSAKELHRKGCIEPFGVIERRVRWRLIKQLSKNEIALLRALIKLT